MSEQNPPAEETAALPPLAAEPAVEAPAPPKGRGTRRTAIIALVAVVVVAVLGSGAFAVWKVFFSGGPQPAEALPASTVAILSIDLNPSAGQKIEAIKTIRKFPALKDDLGLDTQDDLRRFIFEKGFGGTDCEDRGYDELVKPWIGKRAAVAAVDLGDDFPAPAIVLQVNDQAKAKDSFDEIVECADFGDDFGFAVGEDYLVASDSTAHAKQILEDGQEKPLSEDASYQRWTDEAGDQGVVNFYVAKKAAEYVTEALEEFGDGFTRGFEEGFGEDFSSDDLSGEEMEGGGLSRASAPQAEDDGCDGEPFGAAQDQLDDFEGLAGTIRFADGGMELSVATSGVEQLESDATVGDEVGSLPGDTTLVAGLGVPDGYAEQLVDTFKCGFGSDDFLVEIERETGLTLPDDLETLLGEAVTISLGGDAPGDLEDLDDPENAYVGVVLHGDAEKVEDLIPKIEDAIGIRLADIPVNVESTDSRVVLSPSEEYADALGEDGDLGGNDSFRDAVPEADRATGILYVDFNSAWRETLVQLVEEAGSAEDAEETDDNTEPLESFGLSTWNEDGTSHVLLKLTTD